MLICQERTLFFSYGYMLISTNKTSVLFKHQYFVNVLGLTLLRLETRNKESITKKQKKEHDVIIDETKGEGAGTHVHDVIIEETCF